jgi:hypothetical protein
VPPNPYASAVASASASARASASAKPEDDPRFVPEGVRDQIGATATGPTVERGERVRSGVFPIAYSERIGNAHTTAVFPFYYDRKTVDEQQQVSERESFYGLYYRKRSALHDVDFVFPFFSRWRDDQTTTWVIPPVLWRDGPNEWHRWLAPLFFASSQADGGYFHAPLLLTFSHHNAKRAFSLIGGLGFYDRTENDVDWGVFPFVFGGHNGDKLTNYFLIPPLLTYHAEDREAGSQTTVVGPVYTKTSATTSIFDVFPLVWHNHGPDYTSTTIAPLFHYSESKNKSLTITPLFLHAKDSDGGTTTVTWVYSQYRGRTQLDLAGPIVPLYAHYKDPDAFKESWLFGPVYTSSDPTGWSVITPLFAHFREYGVSRTTWVFPTFEHRSVVGGWEFNVWPLVFTGKSQDSYHSVVAPLWWDFESGNKRTTIAFPVYWRFRDEEGVSQIALNTYYTEHYSRKGNAWDFYFFPVVHVGEGPDSNAWDVLFGLVGYKREGGYKQLKLFWIPIDLTKNPYASQPAAAPAAAPAK